MLRLAASACSFSGSSGQVYNGVRTPPRLIHSINATGRPFTYSSSDTLRKTVSPTWWRWMTCCPARTPCLRSRFGKRLGMRIAETRNCRAEPGTPSFLAAALARAAAPGLLRRLRGRDLLAALPLELGDDVVVDPLAVPPFDRQDRHAVQVDP